MGWGTGVWGGVNREGERAGRSSPPGKALGPRKNRIGLAIRMALGHRGEVMRKLLVVGLAALAVLGLAGGLQAVQKQACNRSVLCNGLNAVSLTGTSTSYLRLLDFGGLGSSAWTVTAWIYPTAAQTNGDFIFLVSNDYQNDRGTSVYLRNSSGTLYLDICTVLYSNDTCVSATTGPNVSVPLSTWSFIAAGSGYWANGQANLWVEVNAGTRYSAAMTGYVRGNSWDTLIGIPAFSAANFKNYTGRIDQLSFYGVALSEKDTDLLYNSGSGRTYPYDTGN